MEEHTDDLNDEDNSEEDDENETDRLELQEEVFNFHNRILLERKIEHY